MANKTRPIINWAAVTDNTGKVYFQPLGVDGSGVYNRKVLVLEDDASNKNGLDGGFYVPDDYSSTPKYKLVWTSPSGSADGVKFEIDLTVVNGESESLDPGSHEESIGGVDTMATTAWYRREIIITSTATYTAGDEVLYILSRDCGDAGDDLAADVQVFSLLFQYDDGT